ncbi:hypothetical protein [Devosia sp. 2618]|uniref:hypothetical protein n=1 Tax=Devosia sp. 2618 TaxID=3156454 RepID=UPI00339449E1
MIKTTAIALVATVAMLGVTAPTFAATGIFGDGNNQAQDWVADSIVTQLRQQGVNVSSVEEWNGLVRAFVTRDDGTQTMQFFTPGTLQPVSL